MTIQQAIEKAIEGGWKPTENQLYDERDKGAPDFGIPMPTYDLPYIYQDPLFWQSLGKAMGWYAGEWKQRAMSFFDETVCEGKDAESFFESL